MTPFQTNLQQVLNYLKQGHKVIPAFGMAQIPNQQALPPVPGVTGLPASAPPLHMQAMISPGVKSG